MDMLAVAFGALQMALYLATLHGNTSSEELRELLATTRDLTDILTNADSPAHDEFIAVKVEAKALGHEMAQLLNRIQRVEDFGGWLPFLAELMATFMYRKKMSQMKQRCRNLLSFTQLWILAQQEQFYAIEYDRIKASPRFQNLDAYGKAAVVALLDQYLATKDPSDAALYFAAAGRLIDHASKPLPLPRSRAGYSQSGQEQIVDDQSRQEADEALLALLQYRVMESRRTQIAEAFATSCGWAYEESNNGRWKNLSTWLTSDSGMYLIVGNEASGKSTMMKYIYAHEKTRTLLQDWAHPDELVTAAFFFWRNGTRLEKSEEGLWRTLLYSALDQQPQLMPSVFPKEWAMIYSGRTSPGLGAWKVDNLRQAFHRLVTQEQLPLKIFLLIDGIDEYQHESGGANFTEIIQFIKKVTDSSTNVKALISSGPLKAFDELEIQSSIVLHNVNDVDIETYVREVLNQDELFRRSRAANDNKAETVISYILNTSNGIFLWAVLSVNAIKQKVAAGKPLDTIAFDLESELAPALREWYSVIWDGMDSNSKAEASRAMQFLLAGESIKRGWLDNDEETIRLIDLALALGDPSETINASIKPWSQAQSAIQDKCNLVATGFMKTWPGFITADNLNPSERHWNPASRIRYCHRSVPEFFRDNYDSLLRDATADLSFKFCPRMAHLKTVVHQLKILPEPLPKEPLRVLWAFVTTSQLAASCIDPGTPFNPCGTVDQRISDDSDQADNFDAVHKKTYHRLLAELDRTVQHHHENLQKDTEGKFLRTILSDHRGTVMLDDGGRDSKLKAGMHWSNFPSDPEAAHPRGWNDSFLSLAVQFSLLNYVEAELGTGSKVLKAKKGRPLLDYALYPLLPSTMVPYGLITPNFIKMLLNHGADPNEKFEGQQCWERALQWQYKIFGEGEGKAVFAAGDTTKDAQELAESRARIFELLLNAGTSVNGASIVMKWGKVPARTVVEASFKGWAKPETVEALLGRFPV